MTDPDMQGGAEWRGDIEDGREVHQTSIKQPSNNDPAALREAFEAVRWWKRGGKLYCMACGRWKRSPEVHAPGCPVRRAVCEDY